jgi:hypothetical protein
MQELCRLRSPHFNARREDVAIRELARIPEKQIASGVTCSSSMVSSRRLAWPMSANAQCTATSVSDGVRGIGWARSRKTEENGQGREAGRISLAYYALDGAAQANAKKEINARFLLQLRG